MIPSTVPPYQWSPGYGNLTPGRSIRLWGRDHAPYDVAATKGIARAGDADVTSYTQARTDGRYEIVAHHRDDILNDQPMGILHGDVFDTQAEANEARFAAGWLVFEEVLKVGKVGPYVPPWGLRSEPDDGDAWADDPRRADGAAADMVYGHTR